MILDGQTADLVATGVVKLADEPVQSAFLVAVQIEALHLALIGDPDQKHTAFAVGESHDRFGDGSL